MSDDIESGNGPIPPRMTIKNQGKSDSSAVNMPEGGDLNSNASSGSTDPNPAPISLNKKKTARIALDQVTAETGAASAVPGTGIASKTIRLAPAMTGQVAAAPFPSVGKALTGMLVSDETKRKTSRISLDAVLPQLEVTAPAGGDSTPKTIRIKRPTLSVPPASIPPIQVKEPPPSVVVAAPINEKSQTSRVDIPPEAVAMEEQQTQKKTIKIRRADGGAPETGAAPRSISISRTEAAVAVPETVQVAAPHWSFVLVAAAAVVTLCVMLYVLMAQAYPSLGWSVGG